MGGASNRFLSLLSTTTHPFPLHLHHRFPCLLLLRLSRRSSSPQLLSRLHHSTLSCRSSSFTSLKSSHHFHFHSNASPVSPAYPSADPPLHPWPEWSHLLHALSAAGYDEVHGHDAFTGDLPDHFVRAARVCLAFATARPGLLRLLSRRDLEVVVENGTPFLFQNGDDSTRRMTSFLAQGSTNAFDTDKAQTVDLMRFILSYASTPVFSSERNNLYNRELVESSVRNLLTEMAKLCYSAPESNSFGTVQNQSSNNHGTTPGPFGKTIEMKRGDWICSRCNFMNFAKNMKCLECNEAKPHRQLTGREWECPQCDFFNYGRNMVCLRCDCKRPGEVSRGTTKTNLDIGFDNGDDTNKADVNSKLAANEEKAQRWFSKISQLDSTSDMSSAISDEDFPEIMPLRKGVNRFVVSTRKTPLERRLANAQYQRSLDSDEIKDLQKGSANKSLGATSSQTLDTILGRSSVSESNTTNTNAGEHGKTDNPSFISSSGSTQYQQPRRSNSNYAPFVPLPADAFAKKPETSYMEESGKLVRDQNESVTLKGSELEGVSGNNQSGKSEDSLISAKSMKQAGSRNEEKEQAEKSERWFKRVAELHDVTDLASAISDEDFPEIMPVRKGENRFMVSKKKDRSSSSSAYKRGTAMEQPNSAKYVPFVPFPPDYFAKVDNPQTSGTALDNKTGVKSTPTMMPENPVDKSFDTRPGTLNTGHSQQMESQQSRVANLKSRSSEDNPRKKWTSSVNGPPASGNSALNFANTTTDSRDRLNSGSSGKENFDELMDSHHPSNEQNIRQHWTGKSLEGSAVKEPNPLDMSEEAKAERWFKRVAQIKDISELSQIPDEDFPSIMPMRKGVNRFVVSKRKTPLERRLTSPQYRKSLPIVCSDPVKEDDGN
ncbi:zinc finger protein VAR3, chloroplastic [Rosa sericea]